MFQIMDPAMVRAMTRFDGTDPTAAHRRDLMAQRAAARRAIWGKLWRGALRRLWTQGSSRLRIRSTGVPSCSGSPISRS